MTHFNLINHDVDDMFSSNDMVFSVHLYNCRQAITEAELDILTNGSLRMGWM